VGVILIEKFKVVEDCPDILSGIVATGIAEGHCRIVNFLHCLNIGNYLINIYV
jgi:hypothetical protein